MIKIMSMSPYKHSFKPANFTRTPNGDKAKGCFSKVWKS